MGSNQKRGKFKKLGNRANIVLFLLKGAALFLMSIYMFRTYFEGKDGGYIFNSLYHLLLEVIFSVGCIAGAMLMARRKPSPNKMVALLLGALGLFSGIHLMVGFWDILSTFVQKEDRLLACIFLLSLPTLLISAVVSLFHSEDSSPNRS